MSSTFPHSPWTKIIALESASPTRRDDLLQEIFSLYWKPVYAFAHRHYPLSDADDLTQNVFAYILRHGTLEKAQQSRGRLRSFLITVTKGVASTGWQRERNHRNTLPVDSEEGQKFFSSIPDVAGESPEDFCDRVLALDLFRRSMQQLESEYNQTGKSHLFASLAALAIDDNPARYTQCSARCGTSIDTLRVQVFRFRQRLRELFANHVKKMVADPADLPAEIHHLLACLSRRGTL